MIEKKKEERLFQINKQLLEIWIKQKDKKNNLKSFYKKLNNKKLIIKI